MKKSKQDLDYIKKKVKEDADKDAKDKAKRKDAAIKSAETPGQDQQETMAQIENRVKAEIKEGVDKKLAEAEAKEKEWLGKEKISTNRQYKLEMEESFKNGFRDGQLQLRVRQLEEKEQEELKPITLNDQLKKLEDQIKYQRSKELETLNNKKAIAILTSVIFQLRITLSSLKGLEKEGLNQFISRDAYERQLKKTGKKSRVNSTTRNNLNYLVWILEQLQLLLALNVGGKGLEVVPLELYPESKKDVQRYIRKEQKLVKKREIKAKAELEKQQKS